MRKITGIINVKEVSLLATLNELTDHLTAINLRYTNTHLRFAAGIYQKGNEDIFEEGGYMEFYPKQIREVTDLIQSQLEELKRIKMILERPN